MLCLEDWVFKELLLLMGDNPGLAGFFLLLTELYAQIQLGGL